jgi:hypothetical protein
MTRSLTTSGRGAISTQEARPLPVPAADLGRLEIDQYLDGDMKPADLIAALEDLTFQRTRDYQCAQPCRLLSIDREVRDFIVAALRRASPGAQHE